MSPLRNKRRQRRRYAAEPSTSNNTKVVVRSLVGVVLMSAMLLYAGNWVLQYFGAGNTIRRVGTTLAVEDASTATVSIEGSEMKRAENGQKLYPGDRVATNSASQVRLSFFDGSVIRMNELTDITIAETFHGAEESDMSLRMQEGMLWVQTPHTDTFSGAITRVIETPAMTLNIPAGTEALIQARSLIVYAAEGLGVTIEADNAIVPVIVGEGQKFTLPPNAETAADLYAYRSPLDPLAVQIPFVEESRTQGTVADEPNTSEPDAPETPVEPDGFISITSPTENAIIDTATVTVSGVVNSNVDRLRINGYNAPINNGAFSQELALADEDEIDIVIVALAADSSTLSEVTRRVTRNRTPPPPPTITTPANAGDVYETTQERLEIRGTAPEGTVGIVVNDYRLQLFEPGNRTWTYLASTNIDNYQPGRNVYRVYAINAGGYRSEPAELVIVLGSENIPTDTENTEDSNFSNNAPLQPGSIQVVAPTPGNTHNASQSSFLIEGTTSPDTATFWINNYRLRLYEEGKTTWNYIADTNMNTLQPGTNTYEAVARDANNQILDRFTYTVEYEGE